MEDIAPELLDAIRRSFVHNINSSSEIKDLYRLIQEGTATYSDAQKYALLVGDALSQAFAMHLSSASLPDGRMYYNIADRVIRPMLSENHTLVSDAAVQVQTSLNQASYLGIKAQTVPLNAERVEGIINKVSSAETYDEVAWMLDEPIKTFSMNVVDETLKANVDFQGRVGLKPKIIRKAGNKCCEWCARLAGEYDYPELPHDVFRRHNRCRCTTDYDPGDGRRQDVWSKQWR